MVGVPVEETFSDIGMKSIKLVIHMEFTLGEVTRISMDNKKYVSMVRLDNSPTIRR